MSGDVVEEVVLIWSDPDENKNKFYHVMLHSDDTVEARYGRVRTGSTGTTDSKGPVGKRGFDKLVAAKKKKGYKESPLLLEGGKSSSQDTLREAARSALIASNSDPRLAALVNRLVAANAHEILKASGGKLQVQDGQIKTPLGLLTKTAIDEARGILSTIQATPSKRRSLLADYMTLVPQDVGMGRGWVDTFLAESKDLDEQGAFLDQLEQSLDFARQQNKSSQEEESYEDLFLYRIQPVDDQAVIRDLEERFKKARAQGHSQRLYNSKLKNVFTFTDAKADAVFEEKSRELGNQISAWHGTRAMNLLSIASKGLKSPRELKKLFTTGAMFGQGIYSSTCSTKALGYSDSGIWSSSRSDTHYLFAVEVALGNTYEPGRSQPQSHAWDDILDGRVSDTKGARYNSINVGRGYNGLLNPETIVPNSSQMSIRYLLELTEA